MFRKALTFVLLVAVLSGCTPPGSQQNNANQGDPNAIVAGSAVSPTGDGAKISAAQPVSSQPTAAQAPALTATAPKNTPAVVKPTPTLAQSGASSPAEDQNGSQVLGPDSFPEGVSPLTGLPVENIENLALSPALVSVTNFPVTARPQSGLSFSPFVYEMYIGEGMTRFLAIFYGDYPKKGGETSGIALSDDRIGPVRSGRLPYESIRMLYNGFLVMASASSVVLPGLSSYTNVFGSDTGDINSALIPATKLEEIASKNPKRLQQAALTGLQFDSAAPANGKLGKMIWIPFSFLNQVIWRYDESSGAYQRYQDNADGKTFVQATDRLNEKPLAYSNVVVLFANHQAKRETLINIDLMYVDKMPALLFRDGKMYEIYWTTANGEYEKKTGLVRPIRFVDAQGNPFPLKPGQTWVEIVQQYTKYNETVDSEVYFELKNKTSPGSGSWAIHFFPTIPERK